LLSNVAAIPGKFPESRGLLLFKKLTDKKKRCLALLKRATRRGSTNNGLKITGNRW
jgi:hypothetical protein